MTTPVADDSRKSQSVFALENVRLQDKDKEVKFETTIKPLNTGTITVLPTNSAKYMHKNIICI